MKEKILTAKGKILFYYTKQMCILCENLQSFFSKKADYYSIQNSKIDKDYNLGIIKTIHCYIKTN